MDMVFGAISLVRDGHGTLIVTFAGMRWMLLFLLPFSRACDGHGCFDCHFAGWRWTWYIGSRLRGHAMDGVVLVPLSRVCDGVVVLVAISRVSDGLLNWSSLSRECDGCGCFG